MERNCEPMNKNRIEGAAEQGERAKNREALVIKAKRRPTGISFGHRSGGYAAKECDPYLGRSRVVPERVTVSSRSEKSAAVVVTRGGAEEAEPGGEGPNEKACVAPWRC